MTQTPKAPNAKTQNPRPETTSGLPAMKPWVSDEAAPYWEGTRDGRLVLPRCTDCDTVIWYPRGFCPACASFAIEWFEADGTGVVYSHAVARRGQGPYRDVAPYVVAYVELDVPGGSGPRVMTNIVGCDPDTVEVGMAVTAVFDAAETGDALLRFRPV